MSQCPQGVSKLAPQLPSDPKEANWVVIVEGKNDRRRLARLVDDNITILLTYGIPSQRWLDQLIRTVGDRPVIIFTDADSTGRRIRGILAEAFPHAIHLHTKPSYRGVEQTPLSYLAERLERIGIITRQGPD